MIHVSGVYTNIILHFTLVSVVTGGYYIPYTDRKVVDSVDSGTYTPEVVKMMFPISYLVYSVNFLTCLLITHLVYSENCIY